MNIVFVSNLLTIPQAWRIWWDFLTNSNIPIFSCFLLFSHFFTYKSIILKFKLARSPASACSSCNIRFDSASLCIPHNSDHWGR